MEEEIELVLEGSSLLEVAEFVENSIRETGGGLDFTYHG